MIEKTAFLNQSFEKYTNFVKKLSGFVFEQADYNLDFDCIFDLKSQNLISNFISSYNKDLLVDFTEPDWFPLILQAKGIVSAEGGMLSHTSIIARELGIPCIVGISYENLEKLKNAKSISLDATQGIVKINNI